MIPFNVPPFIGTELDYVKQAIDAHKICGDGSFTKKCHSFLEERFGAQKALLTTSGTTALELHFFQHGDSHRPDRSHTGLHRCPPGHYEYR